MYLEVHFSDVTQPGVVIMTRHGESEWSKNDIFCGWYDALLTDIGKTQAHECGKLIKDAGYKIDVIFTSFLTRANQTVNIIKKCIDGSGIPVKESWRLNERHYGDLTGYVKSEVVNKYGIDIVNNWRRSYNELPPVMSSDHEYYMKIWSNPKLNAAEDLNIQEFHHSESLKTTLERVKPYWEGEISPYISEGKTILIVTHGTILRALSKILSGFTEQETCKKEFPTGRPLIYTFDKNMNVITSMQFLGDQKYVEKAISKLHQPVYYNNKYNN
ncbi:2,3-bisphosphoglycerate-dependent phosphoglycerate mutase-like isoform X2 [Daktulosphaira vitifoliae]|uniref:2,3-bisphosphoglycerate-dependent phosphoglycerate mutase-like isoform X2 n=1 Tax=Daktulosphaira vitifoliae TaxID=58002 RepID=UPI0021AA8362|nr:2,3-bisphosphoglycerate-dependent phosphoglycerate mutase-like isoform X2 [Daktulosphaira vitifoliae]